MDEPDTLRCICLQHSVGRFCCFVSIDDVSLAGNANSELSGNLAMRWHDCGRLRRWLSLAARDPLRHWPIVLVGLIGKVLGPIGFLQAALTGALPWRFGLNNISNDLIWWIPFTLILRRAYQTGLK